MDNRPTESIVRPLLGDDPPIARLIYGTDVRESLRAMSPNSVHTVITSPPYWGLRSYLAADSENKKYEMGLEPTIDEFIANLVGLFCELKRVLRKDGTVWLNLGDMYCGGGRAGKNPEYMQRHTSFGKLDYVTSKGGMGPPMPVPDGMRPKNMVGMPWRVAFALQKDGWYLRSAAPWIRRSVMPESCTDRPSSSVEYIFLLAHPDSGGHYFYDIHGSRPPLAGDDTGTRQRRSTDWFFDSVADIAAGGQDLLLDEEGDPLALVVNPKPYAGAHFACFPPKLVEPCVLLSTSARGACSLCGVQWKRVVAREGSQSKASGKTRDRKAQGLATAFSGYEDGSKVPNFTTIGWEPDCDCKNPVAVKSDDSIAVKDGDTEERNVCAPPPPVRPVVLDLFSGSGTTGAVALTLGRNYIGLDLNESYLPLAESRILQMAAPAGNVVDLNGTVLDLFGDDS